MTRRVINSDSDDEMELMNNFPDEAGGGIGAGAAPPPAVPISLDRNTSVGSGEQTPPSSSLEVGDAIDVLTLAPSSPAAKSTDDMHFANSNVADLSVDEVAIVLSFLKHNEIMRARVCTTWKNAAKNTLVPLSDFHVYDIRSYNAMRAMSRALPNLQHISIGGLQGNKYADGEEPDEEWAAYTAHLTTHDLNIISNFRKLIELDMHSGYRELYREGYYELNGKYPVLFNFPILQRLALTYSCRSFLKLDLDMLSGCPLLRELRIFQLQGLTGDLKSLRVMKNTLEVVRILYCDNIQGNFMELADFPCLKELWICDCPVTGDVRDIQEDDFRSLEQLVLPPTVIGGDEYRFQRISDVPSFMHAIHPLLKRFPETFSHDPETGEGQWALSVESDDWYEHGVPYEIWPESNNYYYEDPPFSVDCIFAEGLRCGWRWSIWQSVGCEVNWLDPEPSEDSDGYDKYVEFMQRIEDQTDFYRGYYEPPTEEEYHRLCLRERGD